MSFREETVPIPTRAGHSLTGTLFTPEHPSGHSILISSATGMLRRFYYGFSKHFASRGYTVLTFDYWGIGDSAGDPQALKKNSYDLVHWGANDQAGAVRAPLRVALVAFVDGQAPGHSAVGGNGPNITLVRKGDLAAVRG